VYGCRSPISSANTGSRVAIIERNPKRRVDIDTLLLSCRYWAGRWKRFLAGSLRRRRRIERLTFSPHLSDSQERPAASFLPDHGFEIGEGHSWRIAVDSVPRSFLHQPNTRHRINRCVESGRSCSILRSSAPMSKRGNDARTGCRKPTYFLAPLRLQLRPYEPCPRNNDSLAIRANRM